jgi:hypothetical protein
MKHDKYFMSYYYVWNMTCHGYNNTWVELNHELTYEDVQQTESAIKRETNYDFVVILNICKI